MLDSSMIWAILILLGITIYIITDGFDLGIGILLPFIKKETAQDELINSIAPIWDGNETWLVLGGAALMGAFPLAYAVILEAYTIPILVMLFALILRGVAFEFRVHSNHKKLWTLSFIVGSWVTTFMQGMMAGAFLQGFQMNDGKFTGGNMDWLSPFSILAGFALLVMFALLGQLWGMMKCHTALRNYLASMKTTIITLLVVMLFTVAVSMFFTQALHYNLSHTRTLLITLSFLGMFVVLMVLQFAKLTDTVAFLSALIIVIFGMLGFIALFFPYIIPPSLTLLNAASSQSSQMFSLIGTLVMLPIILLYIGWTYYIFRGKVGAEGY